MPAPAIPEADLIEIFSSIQGEGMLVGCRQIFVRMAECNLSCRYCDTPYQRRDECRVETAPGSGRFRSLNNPVTLEQIGKIVSDWLAEMPGAHHSLSITGGEPLVQAETLQEWLPELRRLLPVFLETNGTLPEALQRLLPHIDFVSMDIKLPSQAGIQVDPETQRAFLALAREKPCQVKLVVGESTTDAELVQSARLLQETAPDVPLILQPVTRRGVVELSAQQLLVMQARLAEIHPLVRIIPQTHRFLELL